MTFQRSFLASTALLSSLASFEAAFAQEVTQLPTLQVHDELVFDTHKDEVDLVKPIIREKMIQAIKTNVPLEVEIGIGYNWLHAH